MWVFIGPHNFLVEGHKIMANDVTFNVARGRVVGLHERVRAQDPTGSVLTIIAIQSTELTGTIKDVETIAELLALSGVDEANNSGYSRLVYTDTTLASFPVVIDDTLDLVELPLPDPVFTSVSAGDGPGDLWTDIVIAYDKTGSETDANLIPMVILTIINGVTPNGGDITVQASGGNYYLNS